MQSKKHGNLFGIKTKFRQLTMESLFDRFPHLVEDIFGLLSGETSLQIYTFFLHWKGNEM